MRTVKTDGVIIKRQDFGEADRIVTLFTKKYGKIRVLGKGVRRIQSRRGPHIELFNQATFFIHKGRTFDIITEAQVRETYPRIRKNLELIGLAYYVCELVDGLCAENQPHPNVYDLLVETLEELERGVIQKFERNLLSELGFLPRNRTLPVDTASYIEQILERRIKSKKFLSKLSSVSFFL